jgi:hypothetical protein
LLREDDGLRLRRDRQSAPAADSRPAVAGTRTQDEAAHGRPIIGIVGAAVLLLELLRWNGCCWG